MRVRNSVVVRRVKAMPHSVGVDLEDQEIPGVVLIAIREDQITEWAARALEQALDLAATRWARLEDPRELLCVCEGARQHGGTVQVRNRVVVRRVESIPHNGGLEVADQEIPGMLLVSIRQDQITDQAAQGLEEAMNTAVTAWARLQ